MSNILSAMPNSPNVGVSLDNARRKFNLGDKVSHLAIQESPFFVYLSRVGKMPTNDPVFKFLEQRHQWQRRNFAITTVKAAVAYAGKIITDVRIGAKYDVYGRVSATYLPPAYLLPNQVISVAATIAGQPGILTAKITSVGAAAATYVPVSVEIIAVNGDTTESVITTATIGFAVNGEGQVIGSSFAEATLSPGGWKDELYTREGYAQIFKTAVPLFSGSSLATEYRGISNEFQRVWLEKIREHKMDIEYAMLMGVGRYHATDERYTWGIVPYTERFGVVQNFTYANSNYDSFIDFLRDFMAPESGNSSDKLVLASRKVIAWFQKLAGDGFLKNTVTASSYNLDVQNIKGAFGHKVTKVDTVFGSLHFVQEPLFRGLYENIAVAIDLKNVKYRPLIGNGVNRDTHILTNVQENDRDGRKDMLLTEAGLRIDLPETHALLRWS
jgi:hypothetical protein